MTPDSEPGGSGLPGGESVSGYRLPGGQLSGGRMTWAAAVSGPLAGCTCLWQDLDGLHVEPPPPDAPPTSILWGWRGESVLARVRLDGDTAYVAVLDVAVLDVAVLDVAVLDVAGGGADPAAPAGADAGAVVTVPWALDDGRVAAAVTAASAGRGPAPGNGGVGAEYEQVIVGGTGTGPVTFVRPARASSRASLSGRG
jgi:hypothetical protein